MAKLDGVPWPDSPRICHCVCATIDQAYDVFMHHLCIERVGNHSIRTSVIMFLRRSWFLCVGGLVRGYGVAKNIKKYSLSK